MYKRQSLAQGEFLLLLNNDTRVITPDWMEELLGTCQRPDVGIVGAKLYYPDDTIQHAGVVMKLAGVCGPVSVSYPHLSGAWEQTVQLK